MILRVVAALLAAQLGILSGIADRLDDWLLAREAQTEMAFYWFERGVDEGVIAKVDAALTQIADFTSGAGEPPMVNVVTPYYQSEYPLEEPYQWGQSVTITAEMADSCVAALACAYLDANERWIGVGVEALLAGEEIDERALAAYYSRARNMSALSLSAIRFSEGVCGEKSVAMARQSAAAYLRYIIDGGEPDKNQWLQSIGARLPYDDSADEILLALGAQPGIEQYDIVASSERADYYIALSEGWGAAIASASDIEAFVASAERAMAAMAAWLEPFESRETVVDTARFIYFYVDENEGDVSYAYPDGTIEINFSPEQATEHEIAHVYLGDCESAWLAEGLATWAEMTQVFNYQFIDGGEDARLAELLNPRAFSPFARSYYREYYGQIRAYYEAACGRAANEGALDTRAYVHAVALAELLYEGKHADELINLTIFETYEDEIIEGGALTYMQAASIVDYLIERDSLPALLEVYADYDLFVSRYGGFAEICQQWRAYLEEKCL